VVVSKVYGMCILFVMNTCYTKITHSQEIENVIVVGTHNVAEDSPITFQNIILDDDRKALFGQEPSFFFSSRPSITSYSDSGSFQGYSYFRLRGMDQSRINFTLNGAPLNEPEDQGVYFSNYPNFMISLEQMQIQRGTGISQNGIASYAGSVQFYSKSPSLIPKKSLSLHYGSFNSHMLSTSFETGLPNNSNLSLTASTLASDGYKEHSSNTSSSIFINAEKHTSNGLWKLIAFNGNQRNELAWLGVTKEKILENRRSNANSDEDDQFRQSMLILNQEQKISEQISISSGLFASTLKGNYDFDLNNFLGLPSSEELYNYGFDSQYTGGFSSIIRTDEYSVSSLGVYLDFYGRNHIGSERSFGELYRNKGSKDSQIFYVKHQHGFGSFDVLIDLQYRTSEFRYTGDVQIEPLRWHFFNPVIGLGYSVNQHLSYYYSIGKSQREPTRNDLFGGMDNLESDDNGEPLLYAVRPEEVIDHELGLRWQNKNMWVQLNGFYMDFDHEITLSGQFGPNGLALTQDVDSSTRSGVEFEMKWNRKNWRTSSNIAFVTSNIKDGGETFKPVMTPRWVANQEIALTISQWELAVNARYQSDAFIDFANSEKLKGHFVLNASVGRTWENVSIWLRLNNLTKVDYFNNGFVDFDGQSKYFVAAPFNFSSSVIINF
jgi:iron complex outermembrane recepter protein